MKGKIILLFLLFLIASNQSYTQERLRDYFFMLDVSGSMVGKGDGKGINIFDDVKKWIKDFVSKTNEGEIVVIFPFEKGLLAREDQYFKRVIKSDTDKNEAYKFIDNLKAEGQSTWLTDSYATLTQKMKIILNGLINDYDNQQRDQIIIIYTDGKGNGPLDTDMNNFIEKYKLVKNDYENLITKFVVIGDINVQINESDKKKLEDGGIDVEARDRDEIKKATNLNVKPNSLIFYNYNPKSKLQILNVPKNLEGVEIGLKIYFDENLQCLFDYNPKKITLGENNIFDIEISFVETEQCLKYLSSSKIDTLKGKLNLELESELVIINPSSNIDLYYLFEPIKLKFSPLPEVIKTDEDEIKFGFVVYNKEHLKNEYEATLSAKLLSNPDLEILLEPSKIKLSNKVDTIFILINKDNNIKSILKNISDEYTDTLELSAQLTIDNPNVTLDNSKFKYSISFTPVKQPVLLYILIALFVIGLLFFIICKIRTAKFPQGAKLILPDGTAVGYLKGKFCKSYLTLGNTAKDDFKITIAGLKESYLKISPLPGFSLKVQPVNPKIKVELPDGISSESIIVMPGSNFYLVYETNKIEIIYQK